MILIQWCETWIARAGDAVQSASSVLAGRIDLGPLARAFDGSSISSTLLTASIEGVLAIAVVWGVGKLFPRMPAAVRASLWWIVCAKLLLGLIPIPPIAVPNPLARQPILQAPIVQSLSGPIEELGGVIQRVPARSAREIERASDTIRNRAVNRVGPDHPVSQAASLPWRALGIVFWVLGAVIGLVALTIHVLRTQKLLRGAESLDDPQTAGMLDDLARRIGLRRAPRLMTSWRVDSPQVIGLRRPTILLPEALVSELSTTEKEMTLCHELAHVRRKDLWLGWVPAIAERVFWFHPLVHLAAREYALAREAACDAEVIHVLEEAPQDYGRLLLRFGTVPRMTGLATAGVASTTQTLRRRLLMLQHAGGSSRRRLLWLAVPAAAVGSLVPFHFGDTPRAAIVVEPGPAEVLRNDECAATPDFYVVAPEAGVEVYDLREGRPTPAARAPRDYAYSYSTGGGAAIAAPTPVPAPEPLAVYPIHRSELRALERALARAESSVDEAEIKQALDRLRELEAIGAVGGAAASSGGLSGLRALDALGAVSGFAGDFSGGFYGTLSGDEDQAYVFMLDANSAHMSGSTDDLKRARRLMRRADASRILYFRDGDDEYAITEGELLRQAEELVGQYSGMTERQAELAAKQAELGERQAELGRQQAELGLRQAELGVEMARVQTEIARAQISGGDEDALHARLDELAGQMESIGEQQGDLGDAQGRLGEQQGKLGELQGEAGSEQAELAEESQRAIWKLFRDAREAGKITPIE
ncbi:MAG: hypothetical protein IT349_08590 [Candidatus Eisenbacteria bacterium]|nr:hypothetical protein [Candidatus Eisenbacteria bacterium]